VNNEEINLELPIDLGVYNGKSPTLWMLLDESGDVAKPDRIHIDQAHGPQNVMIDCTLDRSTLSGLIEQVRSLAAVALA
jgi:hypothetical protein